MFNPADSVRDLDARGLLRERRIREPSAPDRVRFGTGLLVGFGSNDYLGLAADPRLTEALIDGARRFGVGAGASHLVGGHYRVHEDLEARLAAFVGLPRALYFSSGYGANLAVLASLADPATEIFADRLNHASLNDGMRLTRARFHRYRHGDAGSLERMLQRSRRTRKLVVTDAVFSMDGDLAPLADICRLCVEHGAWLVVDDAHGFGVVGPQGRGSLAGIDNCGCLVAYVGTLGKAAGVAGAFVAGSAELIESLVQRARTYIYTTASPPALAHVLLTSLDIIEREEWRRERLWRHIALLRASLAATPWKLLPSTTPIQPVVAGESATAAALSKALERRGYYVPAIRPPTVPAGSARLRISLSAQHAETEVRGLGEAMLDAAGKGRA